MLKYQRTRLSVQENVCSQTANWRGFAIAHHVSAIISLASVFEAFLL